MDTFNKFKHSREFFHNGSHVIIDKTAEPSLHQWITVSLMAVIIVTGVIGNVLLILAVTLVKTMRDITNLFVVNLSVCDLLFVALVLPFHIYTYITEEWTLGDWLCQLIGFMGYALTGTTLMNITLIAWNRYWLITNPATYFRTFSPRRLVWMIVSTWILPALILLPALFQLWGKFAYVPIMATCNLLLDHASQSFKLFLLIVRAIIPCGLVVYCYVYINYVTRRSHQRIQSKIRLSMTTQEHLHKKELRLTQIMCALFVVFALSYFPCAIAGIIDWNHMLSKTFHMYCQITVYLGSSLNPVIYGLLNTRFRQACVQVFRCNVCRTHSKPTSTSQK